MNKTRVQPGDIPRLRDFGIKVLNRHGALSPEEEQLARAGLAEMQITRTGGELMAEGAPLNQAQILLDGWAVRQRTLSDGRRQIFSFLVPGDIFGLCARPNGEATCTTVALVPSVVAPLPFLDHALQNPGGTPGRAALDVLALEESLLIGQVVRLGRQSAYERLISLLLEFHDRLATVGLVRDGSFTLPFTQEVLSDALGLSTVHTTRTLQQLRRAHLIETQMTHVRLMNMPLLTEISDYRQPACLMMRA
jgi:CRP-like cAMP-binding protein